MDLVTSCRRPMRAAVLALGIAVAPAAAPAQSDVVGLTTRGLPYAPLVGEPPFDTVPPPLQREFRGVWVASVANIDWPSRPGLPVDSQKVELLAILDRAAHLRLNAVLLQVRPSGDALYESKLEPWSYFLTGQMGRAPEPFYDPLRFAIDEAHKRGIELHAWFNPYRARHPADTSRAAASHLSRRRPSLVKKYGPYLWMDPGEPEVRRQTVRVILDVTRRYDVDGVHIDDYFYPYRETRRVGRGRTARQVEIPFPDDASYRRYRAEGGQLDRDDWRRRNVDLLVEELYTEVKKAKPWVKFGISPFGIWRPGHPAVVRGLDAYTSIYADSRRWLNEGWLDYWTPQLYWPVAAPQQPYRDLLQWWRGENRAGRHVWPGNYTSRASSSGRTTWPVREIFDQIRETRSQLGQRSGNVHFSMDAFLADRDSLVARLVAGPYAEPALVPESRWLAPDAPRPPAVVRRESPLGVTLEIRPATAPASTPRGTEPLWWVVRARYADSWRAVVLHASERRMRLLPGNEGEMPDIIDVMAVGRGGVASETTVTRD